MKTDIKTSIESFATQGLFYIRFDSRHPEVDIPEYLKEEYCVLKFSRLFNTPLQIDKTTISQNLTFNGIDYDCIIPYESIINIWNNDVILNKNQLRNKTH